MDEIQSKQKAHSKRQAGPKVSKKKPKETKGKNAKAFAVQHVNKAARSVRRALDLEEKKHHIPVADRGSVEQPPVVVAVVGPRGVGKSTLIKCLVKKLTRQRVNEIRGPITVVANKKRRLTFLEVSADIHAMVDAAKVADLVLLLVDAQFGKIEMETFEFTQIMKVHPGQKVIGVLNHLDQLKEKKSLKKLKKRLKKRFWDEVYAGAKLFYLTHFVRDEYVKREVENLSRFIAIMKHRPADWRETHSYVLVDRVEDVTPAEAVKEEPGADRTVALCGFVRGAHLFAGTNAHIPGLGDFVLDEVSFLADPCPSPAAKKRRSLLDKERKLYAPMSGVGDILMEKDAVYVQVRGRKKAPGGELTGLLPSETGGEEDEEEEAEAMDVDDSESSEDDDDDDDDDDEREEEVYSLESSSGDEDADVEDEDEEDEEEAEAMEVSGAEAAHLNGGDKIALTEDVESMKEAYEELASRWRPVDVGRINWNQHVYGKGRKGKEKEEPEEEDSLFGSIFRVSQDDDNREDLTRSTSAQARTRLDADAWARLADRFVTGAWCPSEDAQALLDADEAARRLAEDSDGGEAEDEEEEEEEEGDEASDDDPAARLVVRERDRKTLKARKRAQYLEKKQRQRAAFEAAYEAARSAHAGADGGGGGEHLSRWREEVESRAQATARQFAHLEDDVRVQLEGFRAGMYVRMEVRGVPAAFVEHHDPSYPLLVGALLPSEEVRGFVRASFRLHRWYGRILKSGDPVLLSVGWRRYQSVVSYSVRDHNGRNRFIKYTPKHQHCFATFFGPQAPKGTGVLAYPDSRTPGDRFRVCGTGGVEENDQHIDLKKKLKLCGTPYKIFKKTAFVKGMFNSALEASRMVGARVQTVSGVRGLIKKALSSAAGSPPGAVRVSFEDKVRASDIVFCRCWAPLDPPRYCNPVANLLLPAGAAWHGLRTLGQLRHDLGLRAPNRPDSHYRQVERRAFAPAPLHVPARLQARLPFRDKPRTAATAEDRIQAARPPAVREPDEERRQQLVAMATAVAAEAARKKREKNTARTAKHKRAVAEVKLRKEVVRRRADKRRWALQGAQDKTRKGRTAAGAE